MQVIIDHSRIIRTAYEILMPLFVLNSLIYWKRELFAFICSDAHQNIIIIII